MLRVGDPLETLNLCIWRVTQWCESAVGEKWKSDGGVT